MIDLSGFSFKAGVDSKSLQSAFRKAILVVFFDFFVGQQEEALKKPLILLLCIGRYGRGILICLFSVCLFFFDEIWRVKKYKERSGSLSDRFM